MTTHSVWELAAHALPLQPTVVLRAILLDVLLNASDMISKSSADVMLKFTSAQPNNRLSESTKQITLTRHACSMHRFITHTNLPVHCIHPFTHPPTHPSTFARIHRLVPVCCPSRTSPLACRFINLTSALIKPRPTSHCPHNHTPQHSNSPTSIPSSIPTVNSMRQQTTYQQPQQNAVAQATSNLATSSSVAQAMSSFRNPPNLINPSHHRHQLAQRLNHYRRHSGPPSLPPSLLATGSRGIRTPPNHQHLHRMPFLKQQ